MSDREKATALLARIPDCKIDVVIAYLQGVCDAVDIPNAETVGAMNELDAGGGKLFTGNTEDLFADLLSEG